MKKQTATDYLFEQLWKRPKDKLTWNALKQQAKIIEKGQIIDAWEDGQSELSLKDKEQYYIDTYGK